MAMIQEAILAHLKADATVSTRVGTRITFGQPAQSWEGSEYLRLQRIGHEHLRGTTTGSGVGRALFQLECWSTTPGDAIELAEKVRASMDTFKGNMGTGGEIVYVEGAFCQSESDDYDETDTGGPSTNYVVRQDWDIWHAETAVDLV